MARLTFRQILIAIALGTFFAALQGEAPISALARLSTLTCSADQTDHC